MANMTDKEKSIQQIYDETHEVHINTGEEKIHAKRMGGKFRNLKWLASSVWLLFFVGPFIRWGERQAVLFDIPNRQFHIFEITILPQDFWMLSLVLLFFAILLAVVTALAGRIYCGFFCFQTIWTDVFTLIETKIEGNPAMQRKFKKAPMSFEKFSKLSFKYFLWLLISIFTGISFAAWFVDVFELWGAIFTFNLSFAAYATIALFTVGTFVLAGFLREQTCFWLCPYARIQAVMVDKNSVVPSYDAIRGEPRGRLKKGELVAGNGHCIECKQCIAVCPTGVDIRTGQQEGCIMCALCIDACDEVMEKINKPRGLIKYASWESIMGHKTIPILKRTRFWVYSIILLLSIVGIIYGIGSQAALELKVIHARLPLFVMLSDGSVQNKYTLKILNKKTQDLRVKISARSSDIRDLKLKGELDVLAKRGKVTSVVVFATAAGENIKDKSTPVIFIIKSKDKDGNVIEDERTSMFLSK
jgi:cytochrome c oxidase accessory protein FixG